MVFGKQVWQEVVGQREALHRLACEQDVFQRQAGELESDQCFDRVFLHMRCEVECLVQMLGTKFDGV